jgi:hypothetical protein
MGRRDESRPTPAVAALQTALIALFAASGMILIAAYVAAPTVFADTVPLDRDALARHPPILTLFVGAVLALIAVVIVGIVRRWRWLFWLLLLACASAVLHLPVTLLQLAGIVPGDTPRWYAILQLGSELVQLALAAWMVLLFRIGGVWGIMPSVRPPTGRER